MTGITNILNLLSLLGWIAAAGGVFLAVSAASRRASPRPGVLLAVAGAVLGVIFSVMGAGLIIIEPQQTAVVFRTVGGDDDSLVDEPLGPGINWIIPFIDQPTIYPTNRQSLTLAADAGQGGPINARSNDGQAVDVDVTVIFRITPEMVNQIYRDWRAGYVEGAVVPFTREEVRDVISELTVAQVYGQRTNLGPNIREVLEPRLRGEGIELIDLAVRNISFSPEFLDAVEAKQIAEQEVERADNLAEAARREAAGLADAAVRRAEGERDADIARAEGEAEAIRLRAEADAKALDLINQQISKNPALVQWRYIDELGDNVGIVIIPSNSPFLFDLQTLTEQTEMELPSPEPEPTETPGTE